MDEVAKGFNNQAQRRGTPEKIPKLTNSEPTWASSFGTHSVTNIEDTVAKHETSNSYTNDTRTSLEFRSTELVDTEQTLPSTNKPLDYRQKEIINSFKNANDSTKIISDFFDGTIYFEKDLFNYEMSSNQEYISVRFNGYGEFDACEKKVPCTELSKAVSLSIAENISKQIYTDRWETDIDDAEDMDSYMNNKFELLIISHIDFVADNKKIFLLNPEYYSDLFEKGLLLDVLGKNRKYKLFSYLFNNSAFPVDIHNTITNIPSWLAYFEVLFNSSSMDCNTNYLLIHAIRAKEKDLMSVVTDLKQETIQLMLSDLLCLDVTNSPFPPHTPILLAILEQADEQFFQAITWNHEIWGVIKHAINYVYTQIDDDSEKKQAILILTKLLTAFNYKKEYRLLEQHQFNRYINFFSEYLTNVTSLNFGDQQDKIDYFLVKTVIPYIWEPYESINSNFNKVPIDLLDKTIAKLNILSTDHLNFFTLEYNYIFNKTYCLIQCLSNNEALKETSTKLYNKYLTLSAIEYLPITSDKPSCVLINKQTSLIISIENLIDMMNGVYGTHRNWYDCKVIVAGETQELTLDNISTIYANFPYLIYQYNGDKYLESTINLLIHTFGKDYETLFFEAICGHKITAKASKINIQHLITSLKGFAVTSTLKNKLGINTQVSEEFLAKLIEDFGLEKSSAAEQAKHIYSFANLLLKTMVSLKDIVGDKVIIHTQQFFMQLLSVAYSLDNNCINKYSLIMKLRLNNKLSVLMQDNLWKNICCNDDSYISAYDQIKTDILTDMKRHKIIQLLPSAMQRSW